MATVAFANVTDLERQAVEKEARDLFENNTPGFSKFKKETQMPALGEKGIRIPYYSQRPGGHTWFIPSQSDFNQALPLQTVSMWVYPTLYALPIVWEGATIRSFEVTPENNINSYRQIVAQYAAAAQKHINQLFYGDGSGSLAYSSSTISTLGSNTMNCTTTAATTPGQTKGAMWLLNGQTYQAINTSTAQVRGTFTVTTPGTSSATINLTAGTITSGDPIVPVGAYQMVLRGLGWLISDQSRTLQGLATSAYPDLNAPVVDLNGAMLTPAAIENGKALLGTRNNDPKARNTLTAFMTQGQYSQVRKQGYNFGYYQRNSADSETMKGVQAEYTDGDTAFCLDADMDEDRVYFAQTDQMRIYQMMPFGPYDKDGLDMRMQLGANGTGSDNYQQAIGWQGNPATLYPRATMFIKRAQLPAATQVLAGL